jgi:hypothetical protein
MLQGWRHKVVTILLYHNCIGLVGATLQQVWQYQQGCYKLLTACSKLVDNLGQAVRTQLVDGLWLVTRCEIFACVASIWWSKNVTRLMTQGCNNIVISWLYRTCWNNLATSLIISTKLLQRLTSCSILVDNLEQAVRTQLVDGLLMTASDLLEQPCN